MILFPATYLGEDEGSSIPHPKSIPLHDAQIRPHRCRKVRLVYHLTRQHHQMGTDFLFKKTGCELIFFHNSDLYTSVFWGEIMKPRSGN